MTGDGGAQVGGDFYDVIPISRRKVALVIGDVEGHDMTAATFMGQLRSALRSYLMLNSDPGIVLSLLAEYCPQIRVPALGDSCALCAELSDGGASNLPPLATHHR